MAKQAENDKIAALQATLKGDTASVMQRYGARVAMSGAAIPSPVPSASPSILNSPLFSSTTKVVS